jgi:uncharacterized protein
VARHRKKNSGRRAGSFRTCAGCRKRLPREQSLRLVRDPDGKCLPDFSGKLPGRGMHLCADAKCFVRAADTQASSRVFHAPTTLDQPLSLARSFEQAALKQAQSMLSTATNAGWVHSGRTEVVRAMNTGRAALVLLAKDGSASLLRSITRIASERNIPTWQVLTKEELSRGRGGKSLAVVAVRHRGLARRIGIETERASKIAVSLQGNNNHSNRQLTPKPVRGKMRAQRTGRVGSRS